MRLIHATILLAVAPAFAAADVVVTAPWARASILANRPGAAYLSLTTDTGDRLLSVSSPVADQVMIHAVETRENGVARMVPLEALDLPAGETVVLGPGTMHLMLMQLEQKLVEDATLPLTLTFEIAGEITVEAPVLGIAAAGPEGTK